MLKEEHSCEALLWLPSPKSVLSASLPRLSPVFPRVHLSLSIVSSNFRLLLWSHHHQLIFAGGPWGLTCHFSICYSPIQMWGSRPFLVWVTSRYGAISSARLCPPSILKPNISVLYCAPLWFAFLRIIHVKNLDLWYWIPALPLSRLYDLGRLLDPYP